MQKYIETAVNKKNSINDWLKIFVCTFLPLLVGTYLVMLCSQAFPSFLPLSIVLCAVLCFVAYKIYCSFDIEWEYTLVDNEIRFSKIINKSRRRDIVTVSISKADVIANINDSEHNNLIRSVNKKYNFTSQTHNNYYFIISQSDKKERVCVFFEPSDEMLENFRVTSRGKVFIWNS